METWALSQGDLDVAGDGNVTSITGADRIRQEISCWLMEPLGSDPLYPKFGSKLWDSIGMIATDMELMEIKAEVTRVVNNYIEYQQIQMNEAKSKDAQSFLNSWTKDDIIQSFDGVDVYSVGDTVTVSISLTTASGNDIEVTKTL